MTHWLNRATNVVAIGLLLSASSMLPALSAQALVSPQASAAATKELTPLACEQYLQFVSPSDAEAQDFKAEDVDMVAWTPKLKKQIDVAFQLIQKNAPGLVARAGNGAKIPILLSNGDRASMESNAARIMIFKSCFADGTHEVAETLAHEMTHLIDIGCALSWSKQWNEMVVPRITAYRKKFPEPEALENPRVEESAAALRAKLGIPTDYTAENPTEALAEYAAVVAVSDYKAPQPVSDYLQKNIFSMPEKPNPAATSIRQGYTKLTRGDYQQAITLFTNALKINPDSPVPHWFLGGVWFERNEPELVLYELRTATKMLYQNGVPAYSEDMESLSDAIKFLELRSKCVRMTHGPLDRLKRLALLSGK